MFCNNRAAQEGIADILTGGTKNRCPFPYTLATVAWRPITYTFDAFDSNVPVTPPTAAWAFSIPAGPLLRGGSRNYSSVAWRELYSGSQMCHLMALVAAFFGAALAGTVCTRRSVPKLECHRVLTLTCVPASLSVAHSRSFKWACVAPLYIRNCKKKVWSSKPVSMHMTLFTWIDAASLLLHRNKAVYFLKNL